MRFAESTATDTQGRKEQGLKKVGLVDAAEAKFAPTNEIQGNVDGNHNRCVNGFCPLVVMQLMSFIFESFKALITDGALVPCCGVCCHLVPNRQFGNPYSVRVNGGPWQYWNGLPY